MIPLIYLGFLYFTSALCGGNQICKGEEPIVTTPLGRVKGSTITSRLGRTIYAFRGIRYAKAPINELRFKPPVPVEKWEGIYNATTDGPVCPQPTTDLMSEDCLIVNVYSTLLPSDNKNPKRPVIVFIHAGGFYSGGSATRWAGPHYFMDKDIVLVTFNYRLATLGFLSTGTKEAPGNNGLKDQVQVLKWVKANIEAFGGNPDSVTIMGYSAGGSSVILHTVSPMSQDLFHRAIAMSGSPLGNWPIPTNQLDLAKKQARLVGCPDDTTDNIIKCLKTKPFKELGESLASFSEYVDDPIYIWSPVIEEDFGQQRFLTAHPVELVQSGKFKKVPLITGVTALEFGFEAFFTIDYKNHTEEMNKDWERVAPIAFGYERDTERSKNISRGLRKFYLHDKPVDESQLEPLTKLYADSVIGFSVNRAAKLFSQYSNKPVYYYRFNYPGRYSHYYLFGSNDAKSYGVVHHDDLIYLFYIAARFPLFNATSPTEIEMVEKLTTLYSNFAKTGEPIPNPNDKLDNVSWDPFTLQNQKYLDMGKKLVIHEKLYEERYSEWEKLFPLNEYFSKA